MSTAERQYLYSYPHKTAYGPLDRAHVQRAVTALAGQKSGLYVHLPFCESKCGYCNLFSVAGCEKETVDLYLDAIERQLLQLENTFDLRSVTFDSFVLGGGTPVYLTVCQLERLLTLIREKTGVTPQNTASVVELSPNQTDAEKTAFLKEAGFSRVSIGIQSFHQTELTALRRIHTPESCRRALSCIAAQSFPQYNVDLIYGIPGQTKDSLRASLAEALSYHPTELFVYPLYIRPQTPLYGQIEADETLLGAHYAQVREVLCSHGFFQTSMRRFVRGAAADILQTSCGFEQNLALGCGGRSYLKNLHVCEPFAVLPKSCRKNLRRFLEKEDFFDGLSGYLLNEEEQKRRYTVKNLLYFAGIDLTEYETLFHTSIWEDFEFLKALQRQGTLVTINGRLRLTNEGLSRSDTIGPLFISAETAARSAAFYQGKE